MARRGRSSGRARPRLAPPFEGVGGDPGGGLDRLLYLSVPDVEVGAEAYAVGGHRRGEHALAGECPQEAFRLTDLDEHDVRLRWLDTVSGVAQPVGQPLRALVVLDEPVYVVLEGVEGAGGDHTRLPHPAAERLARPPRLSDGFLAPGEQRSHGRPEPLGGADRDRVGVLAPLARRNAGGRPRVEEPGPVQVNLQPQFPRLGSYRYKVIEREHSAAGGVVGILQAQQPRPREVDILGLHSAPEGLWGDDASLTGQGPRLHAGE